MSDKLDIFDVLKHIDNKDRSFYDDLPPELKKQFVPLLAMRWYSSASPQATLLTNGIVNPMVFRIHKHPGLLYKLLVAISDGKSKRHAWIKKKSKPKASTAISVISEYYQCSKKDAIRYKQQLSADDIIEMADELGYDKELVKKLKAELK